MAKIKSLYDLWIQELKDLYNAETQLVDALPEMADAAESAELAQAFREHLQQTETHVDRLEKILDSLDENTRGKKCKAMQGLIKEANDFLDEDAEASIKDAGLISCAQRVEHYEIAGYGTARTFAKILGQQEAEKLLQETLNEESETDKKLTELAESNINMEAAHVSSS
jgi:ferritin-like metal-binding protein YciE